MIPMPNDTLLDGEVMLDEKILRRPSIPFAYAWTCQRCLRPMMSNDLSRPWQCTCGWTSTEKGYSHLVPLEKPS